MFNFFKKIFSKNKVEENYTQEVESQEIFEPIKPNYDGKNLIVMNVDDNVHYNIQCVNYYFKEHIPQFSLDKTNLLFIHSLETQSYKDKIINALSETIQDFDRSICKVIVVNKFDKEDITKKLDKFFEKNEYDNIYVNLTCGNGFSVIVEHDYFISNFSKNSFLNIFVYSDNDKKVFPLYCNDNNLYKDDLLIDPKRTISNFFKSYGIKGYYSSPSFEEKDLENIILTIENKDKNILEERVVLRQFIEYIDKKYIKYDFYKKEKCIVNLQNHKISFGTKKSNKNVEDNNISFDLKKFEILKHYLLRFNIKDTISYKQLFCLCDGYFEMLTYFILKDKYKLDENSITMNFMADKLGLKNEFDVIYVDPNTNRLSIVECKNSTDPKKITSALYELDSHKNLFGTDTEFQLWITGRTTNVTPANRNRAKQLNIPLFCAEDIEELAYRELGLEFKFKK